MLKNPFDFSHQSSTIEPADNARRFESGSPNMLGITALNASLGLLLELGLKNIETRVLANATYLFEQLRSLSDIRILTPGETDRFAGIVTFQKHSIDNVKLYEHLQGKNVICAYRGDGIRFSPHFYTTTQDIDKALAIVRDFNE